MKLYYVYILQCADGLTYTGFTNNVERRFKHRTYNKFISKSKKYHAHDVENTAKVGDRVTIVESKPYSKLKKWELLSIN